MTKENQFRGFDLFNDIEDTELRNRNRAIVLANIAEDNARERRISPGAAGTILGYFKQVPDEDKHDVQNRFIRAMQERGFEIVAA